MAGREFESDEEIDAFIDEQIKILRAAAKRVQDNILEMHYKYCSRPKGSLCEAAYTLSVFDRIKDKVDKTTRPGTPTMFGLN